MPPDHTTMSLSISLCFLILALFPHFPHILTAHHHDHDRDYLKLELIHINPAKTPSEALLHDTHRLSILHHRRNHHHHNPLKSPLISGASTGSGQYFAGLSIGSPPQHLLLVADTGSDLTWVKCSACRNCSSHPPNSLFFPRHSSTFHPTHCSDPVCQLVPNSPHAPHCPSPHHPRPHTPCLYSYSYADGSTTSGIFSYELTSLNSSSGKVITFPELSFGCSFDLSGPSVSGPGFQGANGVMGLGRGPTSFFAQLGRKFGNKFSYCLLDYTLSPPRTSYLMIGARHDVVAGTSDHLHSTPLISNALSPTFYYIGVKYVIIDGVKLPLNPSVWALDELGNGGTVVDSGTTLSFVPEAAYRQILTVMRRRVKLPRLSELTQGFDLCYNVSRVHHPSFPRMSFVLVGDSVFNPPPSNYFIAVAEDVKCLALQPVTSPSGFSVIGNLMQQGFLFEFDNDESRLLFSRNGCMQ